jgi:hypothetical protein
MKRIYTILRTSSVVTCLGIAIFALPLPAHAGRVHVSSGIGDPVSVVVAPQPVFVQPAPVVVVPSPIVV